MPIAYPITEKRQAFFLPSCLPADWRWKISAAVPEYRCSQPRLPFSIYVSNIKTKLYDSFAVREHDKENDSFENVLFAWRWKIIKVRRITKTSSSQFTYSERGRAERFKAVSQKRLKRWDSVWLSGQETLKMEIVLLSNPLFLKNATMKMSWEPLFLSCFGHSGALVSVIFLSFWNNLWWF